MQHHGCLHRQVPEVQMILQRWPDSYKLLIESYAVSIRLVIEVKGMEVEGLNRIVGDLGIRLSGELSASTLAPWWHKVA